MTTSFKTVGMAQAADLAKRMARERDVNKRVKLAFHLCQLLADADKAIGAIIPIMEANDQYHALLRLVEDAGITTIAADPDTPLVLPE
jgi:hypothetical protein